MHGSEHSSNRAHFRDFERPVSAVTSGVDRAVVFVPGPPITTTGQEPKTLNGPFLMSVDGPGGPDRFGVWRLFNLEHFPTLDEVATRLINQSSDSWNTLNYQDPLGSPPPGFLRLIPNDLGIPEDVASFGTEVAYVANAPNIGLQALVPSQMNPQPLSDPQVQGTLYQQGMTVRAVSTVGEGDPSRSYVLAVEQGYGKNQMLLVDAQLSSADHTPLVKATYPLPGPALSVLGLTDWPAQLTPGDATSATPLELALVPCVGVGLCVTAVNPAKGSFDDGLLAPGLGGVNQIRTPGRSPRGMVADPQTQLLFVADGTAGLTVVDLAVAGGSIDDDGDGIDDRVLGSVDLDGNRAARLARYVDMSGRQIVAVATGTGGVYLVQVAPTAAGLTLYDTNNIELVPDALKASDGTFVLVNDDNDDGAVDASGAPILDLNKTGPIQGEHDLRRIDVSTPMLQGTVTITVETGSDHAALWLSPQKGDALPSPTSFDLNAGQRPPTTIWVEALAPSQADRDIVVHYQWNPPAAVAAASVEDRAALTAVDIRFIAGQHGQQSGASSEDEKLLFTEPEAEDLEQVLRGEETFDQLPNEAFGRVDIVGVDPQSIVSASVHMARGTTPDAGTIVDATPYSGPTAFTMVSVGAREAASQQDALFYDGMPLGLTPDALRQATSAQGVLPIDPANTPISERQVGATMQMKKASGQVREVRRDPAKPAMLQVIDAQEFAAEIVAFKQGKLSADGLRQAYAEKVISRDDMDGALADGSSRLILRFEAPNAVELSEVTLAVAVNTEVESANVGSNSPADSRFPFGSLTETGFEPTGTVALTATAIQTQDARRVFVATYTPPTSFPFVDKSADSGQLPGAGRWLPLRFSVSAPGQTAPLAEESNAMLLRPPVFLVHGLFGDNSEQTWCPAFTKNFPPSRFDLQRVNYKAANVSGYDVIWRDIHQQFYDRIRDYRNAQIGGELSFRSKRVAATKVDAVAHSMGGVGVRWLATDALTATPLTVRVLSDVDGNSTGTSFPALRTSRFPQEKYLRPDNFNDGEVRTLVAIGSPFAGSPFANWVVRRAMMLDRLRFGVPPPFDVTSPTDSFFLRQAQEQINVLSDAKVALPENEVGTALLDLAIGSAATRALDSTQPAPMLVHAIATRANGFVSTLESIVLGDLTSVRRYCSSFSSDTSDLIVPEDSALYGTDAVGHSVFDGYDHETQTEAPEIGRAIGEELLFDRAESTGRRSVNSFAPGFYMQEEPFQCH